MEIFNVLTAAVIVLGILQLILFFKIWGMTNDVDKIKNIISSTRNRPVDDFSPARFEMLLGNEERAKELFKREFLKETIDLYRNLDTDFGDYESSYQKKYSRLEEKYKGLCGDCESIIDFTKYSTYQLAKSSFK